MDKLKFFGITAILSLIIGVLLAETLTYLLIQLLPKGISFVAVNPFDGFMVLMWTGIIVSLTLFLLVTSVWCWFNFKDALFSKEKELIAKAFLPATILFVIGFVFGLFIYLNLMLPFFIETNTGLGLENLWSLYNVIISGLSLALLVGICFELPLLIRTLIKSKLIEKQKLTDSRGKIFFAIVLISAIITPSPDLVSMFLVATPLYLLFEISLIGVQ